MLIFLLKVCWHFCFDHVVKGDCFWHQTKSWICRDLKIYLLVSKSLLSSRMHVPQGSQYLSPAQLLINKYKVSLNLQSALAILNKILLTKIKVNQIIIQGN